jgi:hypothetical protein
VSTRSLSRHPKYLRVVISLDISTPQGLADHVETLSDYLYEYGGHKLQRAKYSEQFFTYLLSACWGKLYRRFCSWQGLGFIRSFETREYLLVAHLKLLGEPGGPKDDYLDRGPGDRTLSHFLYLNMNVIFDVILPNFPREMGSSPMKEFDKLREAVKKAYNGDSMWLYTKDTALGFHYLVYFSFILAGRAMKGIKDVSLSLKKKKNVEDKALKEEYQKHVRAAVLPMKLLQTLLSSTVFQRHICVWTNDGDTIDSLLPKWSEKKDNVVFGETVKIVATSKESTLKKSPLKESPLKESPLKESPAEGGDEDGDTKKSPGEDSNDDDDDGVDDNTPDASLQMSGISGGIFGDKLPMFFGWVRLFVAHFLGKRNLEVYTAQLAQVELNHRPEIRIFAVSSELYQVPEWKEIEMVIRNALKDTTEEDATEIIQTLRERVMVSGSGRMTPEAYYSLRHFRQMLGKQKKTWSLYMHCETVVAALLDYQRTVSSTDQESDVLAELSKVLGFGS